MPDNFLTGPLGRPADSKNVGANGVSRLPGSQAPKIPDLELDAPALATAEASLNSLFGRHAGALAGWEAQITDAVGRMRAEVAGFTHMDSAARKKHADALEQTFRYRQAATLAEVRAVQMKELRAAADAILAQESLHRSPISTLQAHAFDAAGRDAARTLDGLGVAGILRAFERAWTHKDRALGAALLAKLGSLSESDRKIFDAKGYSTDALSERICGDEHRTIRATIDRARLAKMRYENADFRFEHGHDRPGFSLEFGLAERGIL